MTHQQQRLTPGAVRVMYESQPEGMPIKSPVVQVLNVKQIAQSPHRFRLIISDGEHYMQAMLATQMNDKIRGGQVVRNALIVLHGYASNIVSDRRIVIITDTEQVAMLPDKVGNPINVELKSAGGPGGRQPGTGELSPVIGGPNPGNSGQQLGMGGQQLGMGGQQLGMGGQQLGMGGQQLGMGGQQPGVGPHLQQHPPQGSGGYQYGGGNHPSVPPANLQQREYDAPTGIQQPWNSGPGSYDQPATTYGGGGSGGYGGYGPPATNNGGYQNGSMYSGQNAGPPRNQYQQGAAQRNQTYSTRQGAPPPGPIYPIRGLSPYQSRWTIKARVTFRSEIREYSNARGSGKLFSVNLLDESGEIKATAFNDAVDAFYDLLEENKVYFISGAKVNMAKRQFSNIQNDYELGLERSTEIIPCVDESSVPTLQFSFVPLNELDKYEKDSMIDVLGLVKEDHGLTEIVSKTTQRPIKKRDLTIVDGSQFGVRMTLWGKQAEQFDGSGNPIISCKSVKVSDFGGRSLSMFSSSTMQVNPDIPECHALRGWFDAQGQVANFKSHAGISGAAGSGGIGARDERKTFKEVKDSGLGEGDKPEYFTAKGTIVFIKRDNISYPACPSEDCNKKVTEDNGMWRCEKCQRTYPAPDHRYIFSVNASDHTGQAWLQCFNEIGQTILGRTAGELLAIQDASEPEYSQIFAMASFRTYIFKCRAKSETYNDQTRVRYSVVAANPVDFVAECSSLIQQIQKYH